MLSYKGLNRIDEQKNVKAAWRGPVILQWIDSGIDDKMYFN